MHSRCQTHVRPRASSDDSKSDLQLEIAREQPVVDFIDTLSDSGQERLVTILDQFLIDVEEGRTVDVPALLSQNADIAEPLQHYLDGLRLVRRLSQASDEDLLQAVPGGSQSNFPIRKVLAFDQPGSSSRLGPYQLREIVGRGAMGIVYRAYDVQHQRQVALKVLAFGSAVDSSRIDRFRREAKTAAALDHPNVVPVYAVGCEAGVNYYAMQLVEGASLDCRLLHAKSIVCDDFSAAVPSACEQSRLADPLLGPDRYRRISQLCAHAAGALDAAHRAGVIHRDVKPSNLLLGNDGQLWVTDFGLARVQTESGLTKTGELIGTVRYMSPEQASGHGDMIDARTDVYGLGATLYELITGVPPFPGDDMLDLLRRIQNSEAPSPQQHDAHIPRNLETIICRAMRPRPCDRYPTAAAMAEDLRRFADGKQILAHSVTFTERWVAWAVRHRALTLSVLTLWASILVVSLISTALLVRDQARTTAALQQSEKHYRQARSIVDSLGSSVAKRLAAIPEAEGLRQEILSETIQHYKQFIAASARDPRLHHDVARTRLERARLTAIGDSYANAELAYRSVLESFGFEKLAGETRGGTQVDNEVSHAHSIEHGVPFSGTIDELLLCVQAFNEWGLLASEHGHQTVAQYRCELALRNLAAHPAPTSVEQSKIALAQALTHNNLGVINLRQSKPRESARELQRAIEILRELPTETLDAQELGGEVSDAFSNLSVLLGEAEQYAEAAQAAEQSLAIRRQSQPAEVAEHQSRLAVTYNNLAVFHWKAGRTDAALSAYRLAAELLEETIRRAPSRMNSRHRLAVTLNNLGMALVTHMAQDSGAQDTDAANEAEQVFQRAAVLAQQAFAADPTDAEAVRRLVGIQNNLAVHLRQQKRFAEAEELLQIAVELIQSLPVEQLASTGDASLLKQIQINLQHNHEQL